MNNKLRNKEHLVSKVLKPLAVLLALLTPTYFLWSMEHGYLGFLFVAYFVALYLPKKHKTGSLGNIYSKRVFYTVAPLLLLMLIYRHMN